MTGAPGPEAVACLVCQEQAGEVAVPGGNLLEDELVVAFHIPPVAGRVYLGHLLVSPRRHCPDFAALERAEAGAVGAAIAVCSKALKDLGAERVYVATVGHKLDHLHVHVLARWPGTPEEVPWHGIAEWAGARRGGPVEIEQTVASLRTLVARD
ncbi:MAG: HIT domain-containing protein [Acidimicrobiales bacterium]|jgi:diadenosine tetraphosphate (Ap4A) HIT family hydrolase